MTRSLSSLIFILLSTALLSGTVFRFTFISFTYGFLLLILPLLGKINEKNIQTRFRLFITIIGLISLLAIIAQIIFQSILVANRPYGHILGSYTEPTRILRYFGLERLDNSDTIRVLRLIFPDIVIFAASTICFVIIRRTLIHSKQQQQQQQTELQTSTTLNETNISPSINSNSGITDRKKLWLRILSVIKRMRLSIQFVIVGFAAFVYPSIINSIYFIYFLTTAFMWSLSIKFARRKFALIHALLVIYTGMHLLTYYLYQFTFFQEVFLPLSLWSNVTGLTAIVINNFTENEPHVETNLAWSDYINPCILLLLYFYFVFETKQIFLHQEQSNITTTQSLKQQDFVDAVEEHDTIEQNSPTTQRQRSLEQSNDQTWEEQIISIIVSILRALERQSYLLSLIAMLAWSITYHSLLTLIFLLWACILWILPNTRKWCLRTSPFFTIYGGILLILQYISGFKISFDQFNFTYNRRTMEQIGIRINDYQSAFIPLFVQSFYMIFFCLTFRQFINERENADIQASENQQLTTSLDSYPQRLGQLIVNLLTKYWIFVSCGMLLLINIQDTVVIYRIIYMIFYLFFILSFQISFGFWQKTSSIFHSMIIIYSMVILIGLFIYQFEKVNVFLLQRFSKTLLQSIGFEVVPADVLVIKLLIPSAFVVVNIIQFYFHSRWMDLITIPSDKNIQGSAHGTLKDIHAYAKQNTEDPNNPYSQQILQSEPKTWQESLYKFYFQTNHFLKKVIYYSWRFGELHSYKFVLFIMVIVAALRISVFNVTLIILTTIGLTLFRFRSLINLLTLILTSLYILASMCYQLAITQELIIKKNIFLDSSPRISLNITFHINLYTQPNDTEKCFDGELISHIDEFFGLYVLPTIALTFAAIIRYRQRHRRFILSNYFNIRLIKNNLPIVFEPFALKDHHDDIYQYDVNYKQADQDLINFLKYLMDFIFYRFGLEICYMTTIIVMYIHMDLWAVFYGIWLGLFLILKRQTIQRMWPIYILFHIITFPLQYVIIVWTNINKNDASQLRSSFYSSNYAIPPRTTEFIANFVLFLFAWQQWRVFKYENDKKDPIYIEAGGSNREIIYDNDVYKNNPTWNFLTNKRNWLDQVKHALFMYGPLSVLSIVYLAGTIRLSYFGLGYLLACFYLIWFSQNFVTKRATHAIRLWNYLIYYCFMVIFSQTCLHVMVDTLSYLLSPCTATSRGFQFCQSVDYFVSFVKSTTKDTNKHDDNIIANTSYIMNILCMLCLLIQKRIFGSYYWEHIVTELDSQIKFAHQGSILFNEILHKKVKEAREREAQSLSRIIQNVKRIKEQQLKLNGSNNKGASTSMNLYEHFQVIRSGDYYMFNDESNENQEVDKEKINEINVLEKILQIILSPDEITTPVIHKETSILDKLYSIGLILVDYFIDLFNENSRDHRQVFNKLTEMKIKDKILQQKRFQTETTIGTPLIIQINEIPYDQHQNDQTSPSPIELTQSSRFYRLFDSLFYLIISRSELICYSAMIINFLISGSFISMLFPLSIFLRATLSSRPSKKYWNFVLFLTQMIISSKYLLQCVSDISDPDSENNLITFVNIVGINGQENGALLADLFLLLSLFLHRSILKQLGLWKSQETTLNNSITTDDKHNEQELFVDDVYAPMFFCDFINMIIIIGFYSQFDEQTGANFVQQLSENKVPVTFLLIFLIQFVLIIIDRALYLCRNVHKKYYFHIFQVILVHFWLFIVLPDITEKKFQDNIAAQFWYISKCIYFGYSSIQIRLGYPKSIGGNFLMKHFNYFNEYCYRAYSLIPFLFELRTTMDWMLTNTSLGLSNWLQLKDIYSNLYLIKCARWSEKSYPTKCGQSYSQTKKYLIAGSLFLLLIKLIWFPLITFSITSSFYQSNPPKEVNIEIKLGGYLPIYQMTTKDKDLQPFTRLDYYQLHSLIKSTRIPSKYKDNAHAFLRDFNPNDIWCINFFSTGLNIWELNQPIRDMVVNHLRTNLPVPVQFSYTIKRDPSNEDNLDAITTIVTGQNTVDIKPKHRLIRKALIEVLNGTFNSQTKQFTISNVIPRFLHVKRKSKPEEVEPFETIFPLEYRSSIKMSFNQKKSTTNITQTWWKLTENRTRYRVSPSCLSSNQDYMTMIFFNDKIPPVNISFFTRYGIMGLYTTFVILVARLLRPFYQSSTKIMFMELPNVQRLWNLLNDIQFIQELHIDFAEKNDLLSIEEQLFAKLLFAYRSPETLIRFTEHKVN